MMKSVLGMGCVIAGALFLHTTAAPAMELAGKVVQTALEVPQRQSGLTYRVAKAAQAPVIDGDLSEWAGVQSVVLDQRSQSFRQWADAKDLSATFRMQWDDAAMYFCAEVTDDKHHAPNKDQMVWANDSVQFAFNAYVDGPGTAYHMDVLNFCVADTPEGAQLVCYRHRNFLDERESPVDQRHVAVAVKQRGSKCVYEWKMDWTALRPVSPWLVGLSGFSLCVNDNDGEGFVGAMEWNKGILGRQNTTRFGRVVFDGDRNSCNAHMFVRPNIGPLGLHWWDFAKLKDDCQAGIYLKLAEPGTVTAVLTVHSDDREQVIAEGNVTRTLKARAPYLIHWDLKELPAGRYRLSYKLSGAIEAEDEGLIHLHVNAGKILTTREKLTAEYGINRPWDDMADAPDVIRRHRGMVAAAIDWATSRNSGLDMYSKVEALDAATAMITALAAGKDYLKEQRNEFWCAHYSRVDGAGMFFKLVVPDDYDEARAYPLLLDVHGGLERPKPDKDAVHNEDYIVVRPWGRGDLGYHALSLVDTMRAFEYVKEWYNIDEKRVFVTGGSMGGYGTWRISSHYPDLFAAAAPVCGGALHEPLENLKNVPVLNQHGAVDTAVPVECSRYFMDSLLRRGYPALHKEYPDLGHDLTSVSWEGLKDWLFAQTLTVPKSVVFTSDSPDRSKAYWLQIRKFSDVHRKAQVTATLSGEKRHQALSIHADNVDVLEFDLGQMPIDPDFPLHIQIGNELKQIEKPLPKLVCLVKQAAWTVSTTRWAPKKRTTRAYLPGAGANLYTGEPLLIVPGTQGSKEATRILRDTAENLSLYAGSGENMIVGGLLIKADVDVSDADLKNFNLIVLGNAKQNAVAKRVLPNLPIKFENNALVAGAREPVSLEDAGLGLCHYNPLAPHRLLFLITTDAADPAKMREFYGRSREIVMSEAAAPGDRPDLLVETTDGLARRQMQFDENWQWERVPGEDMKVATGANVGARMCDITLKILKDMTDADIALWWGSDGSPFDTAWFSMADAAITRSQQDILVAETDGADLAGIYQTWIRVKQVVSLPAFEPKDLEPDRLYKVAIPPAMLWTIHSRKRTLQNVRRGPSYPRTSVYHSLFSADQP